MRDNHDLRNQLSIAENVPKVPKGSPGHLRRFSWARRLFRLLSALLCVTSCCLAALLLESLSKPEPCFTIRSFIILEAGGKPSTWLPPGKLVEHFKNFNKHECQNKTINLKVDDEIIQNKQGKSLAA